MKSRSLAPTCLAVVAIAAVAGTIAIAQPTKDTKAPAKPSATQPEHKLPAGWTEADMQACTEAGTPGKMHEHLTADVGTWTGKSKMWMAPGAEVMESECTYTITSVMDGRYTRAEMNGEMPGMGTFNGFGLNGYDNVAQKFQSTWIDNHSTGIMFGTGELSPDGKVLTWRYTYNCPITKKPAVLREVDTRTGDNTRKLEMYGNDPKSGKEFKMMEIQFTRGK
jgi:hypothetical protein